MPIIEAVCEFCSPENTENKDFLQVIEILCKTQLELTQLKVNKRCPECNQNGIIWYETAAQPFSITGPTQTKPMETPFGTFDNSRDYQREKAKVEAETGQTLHEVDDSTARKITIRATQRAHEVARKHGFGSVQAYNKFRQDLADEAKATGENRYKDKVSDARGHALSVLRGGRDAVEMLTDGTGDRWYNLQTRSYDQDSSTKITGNEIGAASPLTRKSRPVINQTRTKSFQPE